MTQIDEESGISVEKLLRDSLPRGHRTPLWLLGLGLLALLLLHAATGSSPVAQLLSGALAAMVVAGLALTGWMAAHAIQTEQQQLDAVEELIQLRRWTQAAELLLGLLSRPCRSSGAWIRALLQLATVSARYHRFDDAIRIYDRLLEVPGLDPPMLQGLRLGRAMALLHDDRLVDADQAITQLRRDPACRESAGLALLETYRDVKTGHAHQAIQTCQQRLPLLRQQLGHRVADAYVLLARAHDLLGQLEQAQQAYEAATILCPERELHRRYPETAALAGRYLPATVPQEVA